MSVKNQGPGNPESISIYFSLFIPFYPFFILFYPAQRLGSLGVLIMYSSNYNTHLDVKTLRPPQKKMKCIEVPTYVPPAHSSPLAIQQLVQLLMPKVLHSRVHCQDPERQLARHYYRKLKLNQM